MTGSQEPHQECRRWPFDASQQVAEWEGILGTLDRGTVTLKSKTFGSLVNAKVNKANEERAETKASDQHKVVIPVSIDIVGSKHRSDSSYAGRREGSVPEKDIHQPGNCVLDVGMYVRGRQPTTKSEEPDMHSSVSQVSEKKSCKKVS